MEAQHEGLATALDDLAVKAANWRMTTSEQQRDALANASTDLLLRIAEHLDMEEREVLPLIDKYLTEKEWKQVGGSGLKKMSFGQPAYVKYAARLHRTQVPALPAAA